MTRQIVQQTRGTRHGPITRLVSPSGLGQVLKPFIFLDLFDAPPSSFGGFGLHPHSGIATLTWLIQGATNYEDSTGKSGVLAEGGVEWMLAASGVWHTGAPLPGQHNRGFQLWVALPAHLEGNAPLSQYIAPDQIAREGPARVLLGTLGNTRSAIAPPSDMNYLALTLAPGECWRYPTPAGHSVAWIAVSSGSVDASARLTAGDLAVFDGSDGAIDFHSQDGAEFVLGTAAPHPHALTIGSYSVHTNQDALRAGEARIRQIGEQLRAQGRLR